MRRTPAILRSPRWRFLAYERMPGFGSRTVHVFVDEPRLVRVRIRLGSRLPATVVYSFAGEPCFSPQEAASRAALARPPRPPRPVQLELLA